MIYVIDHKDSFTHNVVHQLSLFDKVECDDFSKINNSKLNQASTIVFSPGPGSPKDYPLSSKIYNNFNSIFAIKLFDYNISNKSLSDKVLTPNFFAFSYFSKIIFSR